MPRQGSIRICAELCISTPKIVYAMSSIDLISNFIPVLGYLDDVIILSALIALMIKHIPNDVWQRSKTEAINM